MQEALSACLTLHNSPNFGQLQQSLQGFRYPHYALASLSKSAHDARMSTFDVRHAEGDILVHLSDESFGQKLRQILGETVPRYPHGEISQQRIDHLRNHSAPYPKLHIPDHPFGPICVEVLQPADAMSQEAWRVMVDLTGALSPLRHR